MPDPSRRFSALRGRHFGHRFRTQCSEARYRSASSSCSSENGFADASPHRAALPAVYQQYARTPRTDPAKEAARAVLSPLFGTGFLIDDFLVDRQLFGARQVLFASASSKTALASAFVMSRRADKDFEIVALTSPRNRAFCERVGYYDRVVEYGQVASLSAATPTVLVDMAADTDVLCTATSAIRSATAAWSG